jgi:stearoyl-CoA desaturase (delta-9 desaturase)
MFKFKDMNLTSFFFITGYHIILLTLLPVYLIFFTPSALLLGLSLLLFVLSGLSITAGYHRLFSHSTYKTNRVIEFIMLFFGTMATQGSALRWSYDHRRHHAHIDQEDDPYSVTRGFWHAHILWMFKKETPMTHLSTISDLSRNPLLKFQDKYYVVLMVGVNIFATALVYLATGDLFGSFLFSWVLRQFLSHHSTWFINSLAHYWGHQNYSTEHSAMDNYIMCFLTFGEGYHNYHHTFANDYRNGIKWYHFDPTKWLIWSLSKLGLAYNLRKSKETKVLSLMIKEHKEALQERIKLSFLEKKTEAIDKVTKVTDSLGEKLTNLQAILKQYKDAKKDKIVSSTENIKRLGREVKALKKSFKKDWKEWRRFSKSIMRLKVQKAA